MELGNVLAQLRNQKGLNQRELAQALGVSNGAVAMWETNKRQPDLDMIAKLAEYYHVPTDYLLGLSEKEDPFAERPTFNSSKISYWIGKMGYGNDEIAKRLGISEDLLKNYMAGREDIPYKTLHALSEICEISTDCLIGLSEKSRQRDYDNILPFQYNYDIAKKIKQLCQEHNIDTHSSYLPNLLSLSSEEVFNLIEYGFVPHVDTVIKLADEFNVSTDYLLCLIDEQEEKVLQNFRKLNADDKDIIVGEIKKCIKEQRLKESVAADEQPLRKAAGK